ncbi:hypothetical protein IFM89_034483 [Coptis chinensis]|uniref:Glucan endo-1,3-beta-D-glucosidase n=1 Tax=Coptis chinensis TaxID=261450 RepID=A0A835LGH9_9MAGN|nr:hypothetical protein IFM89_034483 [Coptis chinensis]
MATFFKIYSTHSMAFIMLVVVLVTASLTITGAQTTGVGVCYGRLGNDLPPPAEVVALYRKQNIGSMRIYDPNQEVLQALRDSNIELMLGVPNEDLQTLASDASAASRWVQTNVRSFWPAVRIKYIAVGNEVSPVNEENSQYVPFLVPAMTNIYRAIVEAGLQEQIRVSTATDTRVIDTAFPPSAGAFKGEVRSFFGPIIDFLRDTRQPLFVNVYPYFAYNDDQNNIKLPYALFANPSTEFTDSGNNLPYQNLFDAILDSVYAALEKAGGSSLEIVVSESGWPSAGRDAATTIENARTYNQNLIQHVSRGSPKKPGRLIETYLFAMFNENQKNPEYEKKFGLFFPNKAPVYPINF